MSKHNNFVTFFKKINLLINSLLKKNLNKLNLNNFSNIARSNNFFFIFVALFILFLSYLSIPNIYDKHEIQKELKNQLLSKFNLNFSLPQKIKYNFFPRPHFIYNDSIILRDDNEISKIKKLKIYVSLKNFFSLKNIKVNDVILDNANFNLNNQTYNFFINLLDQNFKGNSLIVKDSNIFYRNFDDEVLFINKIIDMKYYYDAKDLKNIFISKNKIFNLSYSLELKNDEVEKKIISKLNLNSFKLQIENEIHYEQDIKKGFTKLIVNKNKSNIKYELKKNYFIFNFFNKSNSNDFSYQGEINFNPFYSNIKGKAKKINLSSIFSYNNFINQMIKTQIFNNKNLDINLNIIGDTITNYENFENLFLQSKFQEGLIDLDNTKFSWKNFADFEILDSLVFVENNELILDAKLDIIIRDSEKIYKFLQTSKNYRNKINKIDLSFKYNFDQKKLDLNNIKINNKINQNLNKSLNSFIFQSDRLKNKIYFKNTINKAIKAYDG